MAEWRPGVVVSTLTSINKVNQRLARLVLRWVTYPGSISNFRYGTFISVCDLPPRSTQPGHPSWVGAMSTNQRAVTPCGWGVKAGMVRVWVAGKTVWSPRYTHPYLSTLAVVIPITKRYTNHQITNVRPRSGKLGMTSVRLQTTCRAPNEFVFDHAMSVLQAACKNGRTSRRINNYCSFILFIFVYSYLQWNTDRHFCTAILPLTLYCNSI